MTCIAVKVMPDRAIVVTDSAAAGVVDGKPSTGELTKCWSYPHLEAAIALRGPHELLLRISDWLSTYVFDFDTAEGHLAEALHNGTFYRREFFPGPGARQKDKAEILFVGFSPAAAHFRGFVYQGPDFKRMEMPVPGSLVAPAEGADPVYTTTTVDELAGIVQRQAERVCAGDIEPGLDADIAQAFGGRILVTELTRNQIVQRFARLGGCS